MKADHLESLIKLRRDFLSAYNLLMILIGQRLDIDCDDQKIGFRKGFSIVVDKPCLSPAFFFADTVKGKVKRMSN